jgi:hypothetical protein
LWQKTKREEVFRLSIRLITQQNNSEYERYEYKIQQVLLDRQIHPYVRANITLFLSEVHTELHARLLGIALGKHFETVIFKQAFEMIRDDQFEKTLDTAIDVEIFLLFEKWFRTQKLGRKNGLSLVGVCDELCISLLREILLFCEIIWNAEITVNF